jgi:hypothetical protein
MQIELLRHRPFAHVMKIMKAQANAACKDEVTRSSRTGQKGGSSYMKTV